MTGSETDYPEILVAYDAAASWAKQQGHELDGPPREIYLTDPTGTETPRWEIVRPVQEIGEQP